MCSKKRCGSALQGHSLYNTILDVLELFCLSLRALAKFFFLGCKSLSDLIRILIANCQAIKNADKLKCTADFVLMLIDCSLNAATLPKQDISHCSEELELLVYVCDATV